MRKIGDRNLWIGSIRDLADAAAIYNNEITVVMELADNEPMAVLNRDLVRVRVPLSDSGENTEWLISLAIDNAATALQQEAGVLICCSAGMNRSVCVCAAAIAQVENLTIESALEMIAQKGPVDVSPRLLDQCKRILKTRN